MYEFSFLEVLLAPIYIIVILTFARKIQGENIDKNPAYNFFLKGLYLKIIGAISLCIVYLFYYGGGDTLNYMADTQVFLRLGSNDLSVFFDILFNGISKESYSNFNSSIGFPEYNYTKTTEWIVIRYSTLFSLIGLKLYIPTSILLAYFSYLGNFKLYLVFADTFPKIYKQLAIPLLFIPSAAFWGSGILKDTFTFSAIGWFVYAFYCAFITKENVKKNIFILLLSAWVIISIKPYIFIALLPGALTWFNFVRLKNIKSKFLRVLAMPFLLVVLGGGGVFIMSQLGSSLDKYSSVDKALETAVVTQKDLKRVEYKGASFDIGDFDPSLAGIASKIPAAINAGLFRPFIWEARNPVMIISGIENLIFLGLTIRLFFTLGLFGFFKRIGEYPLLIFSLVFALFFAFSVGLTTSNFGSLVRYKIPCEPFYLGMLYALFYLKKAETNPELFADDAEISTNEVELPDRHKSKTGFIVR
jgi:hypothetical protein